VRRRRGGCPDLLRTGKPLYGRRSEKAGVPVEYVENKEAAARALEALVQPGDVVLLKGSHGMEVFKLIDLVFRKEGKAQ
jgi:UDP-N-acetylmuramoyl-tripeptide--D-alanyl-D-alanine ligase